MMEPQQFIQQAFNALKQEKPLVVNITNYVVMNNTANALLAIGASPIMAHCQQEMAEILKLADSLVINMGTLDRLWIDNMKYAAQLAVKNNKPLVLDPVGAGASTLRTTAARELCDIARNLGSRFIIRGNASEIMALSGEISLSGGIDSLHSSDMAVDAAQKLQQHYGCDLVVSGASDYVVGKRIFKLDDGHAMMPYVTGMGCTHSALTGAFAALNNNREFSPGLAATAVMGVAGRIAAQNSRGPGSLQLALLDSLYSLTAEEINQQLNLTEI